MSGSGDWGERTSEELLATLEMFGVRLGLERIRELLAGFDDPHLTTPIVLVAGTNGKGSTAALLAAMAEAAGYRTGLYTSPHLERVTERISVNSEPIDDADLAEDLEALFERAGGSDSLPTYFEALTAAAFLHFREAQVDLAVMEVGLGGRLDATNVSEPTLSLISQIAMDHERHLGSDLKAIAGEKAGILRSGQPAIAWADGEVAEALEQRAAALGCDLVLAPQQVEIDTEGSHLPQQVSMWTPRAVHHLTLALAGAHQRHNLALAVLAAETLAMRGWHRFDASAIAEGSRRCRWPGRLEHVTLTSGQRVLLDAAHNPAGVEALCAYLETLDEMPDLLFGAMRDKDVEAMLPRVAAHCRHVFLTRPGASRAETTPGDQPRGGDPQAWADLVSDRRVEVEIDPSVALDKALQGSSRFLLVCGSIYLVGEVRGRLRERYGAFSRS